MDDKKSFVIYKDWSSDFNDLTIEERGLLITAVFGYQTDGTIEEFSDRLLNNIFRRYISVFDRDDEKWSEIREKRAEAGKLGGAPKGNQNASKNKQDKQKVDYSSKTSNCLQKQAKQTVNVNVNSNVNDNVNENVNVTVKQTPLAHNDLFDSFSAEFGRPLKGDESNKLNDWIESYDESLLRYALEEAVMNGAVSMRYIGAILARCKAENIATAEEARKNTKRKQIS